MAFAASKETVAGLPVATEIAVVGAGLTGSLLALRLAQRGFAVVVIERREDPRVEARKEKEAEEAAAAAAAASSRYSHNLQPQLLLIWLSLAPSP